MVNDPQTTSITHILTFTQEQVLDMMISAYLIDREDVTQISIQHKRDIFNMRLSQEYFRQRNEAQDVERV